MSEKPQPVAWECYYPGVGSIDSSTHVVRYERHRDQHEKDGAEITPLYPERALSLARNEALEEAAALCASVGRGDLAAAIRARKTE